MTKLMNNIEVSRSDDGTVLLCSSRRDVPLVYTKLLFPGGEVLEPRDQCGLADLTTDLMNEGPKGTTPLDWHRLLDREAISVGVGAAVDMWQAGFECLTEDCGRSQSLIKTLMQSPTMPKAEWGRLVKEHRASAKENWAQPANVIGTLARVQALGFYHPNARPAFEKSYARASYSHAVSLSQTAFAREGEVFGVVGGDVDVEEGFQLLRDMFSGAKDKFVTVPSEPDIAPAKQAVWVMDNPKIDQAFFALTRKGIRAGDPDRVALRAADYALGGGGFSSRLMERIRGEMGHTYGIRTSLPERRTASPFSIQSFTQTPNLNDMLGLIDRVLQEVVQDGFTKEECEAACNHLYGAMPLQLTNPKAILQVALGALRAGMQLDDIEEDWQKYQDLSVDEINAAARRIIGDGKFHLAVIGPAASILPQVQDRGEAKTFPFHQTPDQWGN